MNLYEKKLIDHYHNPKNYGHLHQPHFSVQEYNPSCGDLISLEGHIKDVSLQQVCFTAQGCIISKATASLLTAECTGKTLTFITSLTNEDILNLIGISLGPLRLKCALLSLQALQNGIVTYQNQEPKKEKQCSIVQK